jgi:hypothetical protein
VEPGWPRRRQVAPEQSTNPGGSWFQVMPVLSTNTIRPARHGLPTVVEDLDPDALCGRVHRGRRFVRRGVTAVPDGAGRDRVRAQDRDQAAIRTARIVHRERVREYGTESAEMM